MQLSEGVYTALAAFDPGYDVDGLRARLEADPRPALLSVLAGYGVNTALLADLYNHDLVWLTKKVNSGNQATLIPTYLSLSRNDRTRLQQLLP